VQDSDDFDGRLTDPAIEDRVLPKPPRNANRAHRGAQSADLMSSVWKVADSFQGRSQFFPELKLQSVDY
jgi:hypothetical protein